MVQGAHSPGAAADVLVRGMSSSLLLLLLLHFILAVRRTATVYEKVYTVMWCRGHTHQGLLLMFW